MSNYFFSFFMNRIFFLFFQSLYLAWCQNKDWLLHCIFATSLYLTCCALGISQMSVKLIVCWIFSLQLTAMSTSHSFFNLYLWAEKFPELFFCKRIVYVLKEFLLNIISKVCPYVFKIFWISSLIDFFISRRNLCHVIIF